MDSRHREDHERHDHQHQNGEKEPPYEEATHEVTDCLLGSSGGLARMRRIERLPGKLIPLLSVFLVFPIQSADVPAAQLSYHFRICKSTLSHHTQRGATLQNRTQTHASRSSSQYGAGVKTPRILVLHFPILGTLPVENAPILPVVLDSVQSMKLESEVQSTIEHRCDLEAIALRLSEKC